MVHKLIINTKQKNEVVNLTRILNDFFVKTGAVNGIVYLFLPHTSCALALCNSDPGTDKDYLDAFNQIVPKLNYVHPHDPTHVGDHIMSTLIGQSLTLQVLSANILLGTYQKVALIEFDGPRERRISLMFTPVKVES
jgi:secondary thiamine-phosphate synthase enzyme